MQSITGGECSGHDWEQDNMYTPGSKEWTQWHHQVNFINKNVNKVESRTCLCQIINRHRPGSLPFGFDTWHRHVLVMFLYKINMSKMKNWDYKHQSYKRSFVNMIEISQKPVSSMPKSVLQLSQKFDISFWDLVAHCSFHV